MQQGMAMGSARRRGSAPNRKRKGLSDLFVLLDETIVTRNR
jgi:hypothetical protein